MNFTDMSSEGGDVRKRTVNIRNTPKGIEMTENTLTYGKITVNVPEGDYTAYECSKLANVVLEALNDTEGTSYGPIASQMAYRYMKKAYIDSHVVEGPEGARNVLNADEMVRGALRLVEARVKGRKTTEFTANVS